MQIFSIIAASLLATAAYAAPVSQTDVTLQERSE